MTRHLSKRSLSLAGHRTSVALEREFWDALERIADRSGTTLAGLVTRLDASRDPDRPLASALRVEALRQVGGRDHGIGDDVAGADDDPKSVAHSQRVRDS